MNQTFRTFFILVLTLTSTSSIATGESAVIYNANNCASSYLSGPNSDLDPKSVYRVDGVHNSSSEQFFQLTCPIDITSLEKRPISIEVYARYRGNSNDSKHQTATSVVGCYVTHRNWKGSSYKVSSFISFVGETSFGAKSIGPIYGGFASGSAILKCTLGPGMSLFNYSAIIEYED